MKQVVKREDYRVQGAWSKLWRCSVYNSLRKIISTMKPEACQNYRKLYNHKVLLEGNAVKLTNIVKCSDILSAAITEIISRENILSIKSSQFI